MASSALTRSFFRLCTAAVVCCLPACAGAPPKQVQRSCGCADYTAAAARPAWVDQESVTGDVYQSQGMAECTGIKSMDYADADRRARDSLGRMINVQVKSEVISVLKDSGLNGGASHFGQISSEQVSSVLLRNSEIFAHWVDAGSCVIYSGVRITKADIARAIREAEEAERRKLVNQRWRVKVDGAYADIIKTRLGQTLSDLGVVVHGGASGLVMAGNVSDVSIQNDKDVTTGLVNLNLVARSGNEVIWNRQVQGKGVTFGNEGESALIKKAVQDALDNARESLEVFMRESVKDRH
jgi:hypothetical protein